MPGLSPFCFDRVAVLVPLTNTGNSDLGSNVPPDKIFENLERTWSYAERRKSKVLALTVPDVASTSKSRYMVMIRERRNRLNALIMGYTSPNL